VCGFLGWVLLLQVFGSEKIKQKNSVIIEAVIVHDLELFTTNPGLFCAKETRFLNCSYPIGAKNLVVIVYDLDLFMTNPGLFCSKETGSSIIVHT